MKIVPLIVKSEKLQSEVIRREPSNLNVQLKNITVNGLNPGVSVYLFGVIVRVRVVFRKTVDGDC